MPAVAGPDDWFALTTAAAGGARGPATAALGGRHRLRQPGSWSTHGNDPSAVTVPGLDGEPYPQSLGQARAIASRRAPH